MQEFIRTAIYDLKEMFPEPLRVERRLTNQTDINSGVIKATKQVIRIAKAVVASTKQLRAYLYNIKVAAGLPFGGYTDTVTKSIIIDQYDLPVGFRFTLSDELIFQDKRWSVKEIHLSMEAVILIAVQKISDTAQITFEECIHQKLELADTVSVKRVFNLMVMDTLVFDQSHYYV